MLIYFALLSLAALAVLAADSRTLAPSARRAWRYVQPYRGQYQAPARWSYAPRHRDRSRLGIPQCPARLIGSDL